MRARGSLPEFVVAETFETPYSAARPLPLNDAGHAAILRGFLTDPACRAYCREAHRQIRATPPAEDREEKAP